MLSSKSPSKWDDPLANTALSLFADTRGEGCGGISLPQSTARILKASFGTWPSPDSRTFFGIPWLPSWSIPSKSWSKEQGKQLHLRRLSRLVDEPQLQEHRRKMCKTAMQRWSRGGYELPMKMEAEPTETTKDDQQVSTGRGLTMPIMHIYIYYTRTHIIWWYIYIWMILHWDRLWIYHVYHVLLPWRYKGSLGSDLLSAIGESYWWCLALVNHLVLGHNLPAQVLAILI